MNSIEQIITKTATENFNNNPEKYPIRDDATATQEAKNNAKKLAVSLFRNRVSLEYAYDGSEAKEEDYVQYVLWAFEDWVDEMACEEHERQKAN